MLQLECILCVEIVDVCCSKESLELLVMGKIRIDSCTVNYGPLVPARVVG